MMVTAERSNVCAVDVSLYENNWIKLRFPNMRSSDYIQIPKEKFSIGFVQLKQLWDIDQYPVRHPDGYWMLHPHVLEHRDGDIHLVIGDMKHVFVRHGYILDILGPLYVREYWNEEDALF